MSTARGAREEGAGSLSPGAGRRPSSSALTPSPSRGQARAESLPPAARTSATWTPRPSVGEAPRPGSESRGPRGTRRQGCRNECRTAAGPVPGDARGEPGAHGAGRGGLTALRAGRLPDVRGQLHSGWGGTVPRARFPTAELRPPRGAWALLRPRRLRWRRAALHPEALRPRELPGPRGLRTNFPTSCFRENGVPTSELKATWVWQTRGSYF